MKAISDSLRKSPSITTKIPSMLRELTSLEIKHFGLPDRGFCRPKYFVDPRRKKIFKKTYSIKRGYRFQYMRSTKII